MGLAQRGRQTDGDAQESRQIDRASPVLVNDPIQWLTTWVLENEDRSALVAGQRKRLDRPGRIEFTRERPFAFEPPETLGRGLFSSDCERQDRQRVAELSATVKCKARLLAKRLQQVLGILGH